MKERKTVVATMTCTGPRAGTGEALSLDVDTGGMGPGSLTRSTYFRESRRG
jgi:hypothetical protein